MVVNGSSKSGITYMIALNKINMLYILEHISMDSIVLLSDCLSIPISYGSKLNIWFSLIISPLKIIACGHHLRCTHSVTHLLLDFCRWNN